MYGEDHDSCQALDDFVRLVDGGATFEGNLITDGTTTVSLKNLREALVGLGYGARYNDPNHDQHIKCTCGHAYYRHFDPFENDREVGCKYCACTRFSI